MAKVIERVQARYEVEEVEFGRVYKWCPESVLIECECSEIVTLTVSEAICEGCQVEHTGLVIGEDLHPRRLKDDEKVHPWRYTVDKDDTALPY